MSSSLLLVLSSLGPSDVSSPETDAVNVFSIGFLFFFRPLKLLLILLLILLLLFLPFHPVVLPSACGQQDSVSSNKHVRSSRSRSGCLDAAHWFLGSSSGPTTGSCGETTTGGLHAAAAAAAAVFDQQQIRCELQHHSRGR